MFSSTMLEFGPVLPFSSGASQEVTVSNPTAYPIEFYSLEFDSQYLLEEEVRFGENIKNFGANISQCLFPLKRLFVG